MPLIGELTPFVSGQPALASEVNANFGAIKTAFNNSAVLTDVAREITAKHDLKGGLDITGGTLTIGSGAAVKVLGSLTVGQSATISEPSTGVIGLPKLSVTDTATIGGKLTVSSGGAEITGSLTATGTATANYFITRDREIESNFAFVAQMKDDAGPRWVARAGGTHSWGPGDTTFHTSLVPGGDGLLSLRGPSSVMGRMDAQVRGFDAGDSGTSKQIDWKQGSVQRLRLTGNATITFANAVEFGQYELILVQDHIGNRTVTLTGWDFGDFPLVLASGANRKTVVCAVYEGSAYNAGMGPKGQLAIL